LLRFPKDGSGNVLLILERSGSDAVNSFSEAIRASDSSIQEPMRALVEFHEAEVGFPLKVLGMSSCRAGSGNLGFGNPTGCTSVGLSDALTPSSANSICGWVPVPSCSIKPRVSPRASMAWRWSRSRVCVDVTGDADVVVPQELHDDNKVNALFQEQGGG
jgi:hypothetical protein